MSRGSVSIALALGALLALSCRAERAEKNAVHESAGRSATPTYTNAQLPAVPPATDRAAPRRATPTYTNAQLPAVPPGTAAPRRAAPNYTNAPLEAVPPATDTAAPRRRTPQQAAEPEPQPQKPGFNPFYTPAFRPVGALRLGRGVNPDGRVPDSQRTDVIMTYDTIHVSFATVDVPEGSLGRLTIYEEGRDEPMWSTDQVVVKGMDNLSFEIGPGDLPPNRYRAVLSLDTGTVVEQPFQVRDGSG